MKISIGEVSALVLQSNFTCFAKLPTDSLICSGNGLCIDSDVCSCSYGYYGNNCQHYQCFGKNSTLSNVCSANGVCISPDKCQCNINYDGNECQHYFSQQNQNIIYSWGLNSYGELGIGGNSKRNSPNQIQGVYPGAKDIFGAYDNAVYFLTNSSAYAIGKNDVSLFVNNSD
jgi:alpha-tubulin suppressor-like RCC1 family protein